MREIRAELRRSLFKPHGAIGRCPAANAPKERRESADVGGIVPSPDDAHLVRKAERCGASDEPAKNQRRTEAGFIPTSEVGWGATRPGCSFPRPRGKPGVRAMIQDASEQREAQRAGREARPATPEAACARAPEKAGGWGGGSPLLCGEEPCGIEPELRRRKAGWRAPERKRPVRNRGLPCGESP
jgi:hypothetical protein